MNNYYFFLALIFISIAYFLRLRRWEMLIEVYEKPDRKRLAAAFSIGYLFNFIVPCKVGDLIRAWEGKKGLYNGVSLSLSTIVVERYLDIIGVGLIFIISLFTGGEQDDFRRIALFYMALSLSVMVFAGICCVFKSSIKKLVRNFARIFNYRIERYILQLAWALIQNFKGIFHRTNAMRMGVISVLMWLCNVFSFVLISQFFNALGYTATWRDILLMLFSQGGITKSTLGLVLFNSQLAFPYNIYMLCYMITPLLFLLFLAVRGRNREKAAGAYGENGYYRLLPHINPQERRVFLENYFISSDSVLYSDYLRINQDISIIRDYSAGSNATTMLCTDGKSTFFRKYAFEKEGDKLYQQILWLQEEKNSIPVPPVLKHEKTDRYCFYDMPYSGNGLPMFEYVHSMPIEQGWEILKKVIQTLEEKLYTFNRRKADRVTVQKYIDQKIISNLDRIKKSVWIKPLLQYDTIVINGVKYKNLPALENKLIDPERLMQIFVNDDYSTIHGDLTIENIICDKDVEGNSRFYLIDPNTGNIHESSNLDYAKLLQSIHGSYEFFMATREVQINDNKIDFLFTRSMAYEKLHALLYEYMTDHFGEKRTRSIYFHEIVHWLRLLPYKIEKDGRRAVLFYAGLIKVMNDIDNKYGTDY